MSTTDFSTTPVTHVAVGRLLTIADVQKLPTNLPSGDVDYELNNGRLVIIRAPDVRHSRVHVRVLTWLNIAESNGRGEAFGKVGIVLWRDPDRLVGADAAFIARDRCPPRETKEGYLETIPDLVVEIRSKDDTIAELKAKAADYLKASVKTVWLIDPIKRNALVYEEQAEPRTVNDEGVLEKSDLFGERRIQLSGVLKG